MRAVDRCWCDLSGNFFEPFNVSHWEYLSVLRVSKDLERRQKKEIAEEAKKQSEVQEEEYVEANYEDPVTTADGSSPTPTSTPSLGNFWSRLRPFHKHSVLSPSAPSIAQTIPGSEGVPELTQAHVEVPTPPSPSSGDKLPVLRREYDLRPYGLGIIIDLGWAR